MIDWMLLICTLIAIIPVVLWVRSVLFWGVPIGQPSSGLKVIQPKRADPPSDTCRISEKTDLRTSGNAEVDVLIIGAGPAGLSVAACLSHHPNLRTRQGKPFDRMVVLEKGFDVAGNWRTRYDRLHLHTDKFTSHLPFVRFPDSFPVYPSRDQVVSYLESYARLTEIHDFLLFGQEVIHVAFNEKGSFWETKTSDTTYHSRFVVICTGECSTPEMPPFENSQHFKGSIIHSCKFGNGEQFRDQKVLVVGFGNSGAEIAVDLWEHGAKPSVLVRSPQLLIPRDLFHSSMSVMAFSILTGMSYLPIRIVDKLASKVFNVFGDLSPYGIETEKRWGVATAVQVLHRAPVIDIGTIELVKRGEITVVKKNGVKGFTENAVVYEDGSLECFDSVICCTGFSPNIASFIENSTRYMDKHLKAPLFCGREYPEIEGYPPGLFFCGFHDMFGKLRQIRLESHNIANEIASKIKKRRHLVDYE